MFDLLCKSYYFRIGLSIALALFFGAFGLMLLKEYINKVKIGAIDSADFLPVCFVLLLLLLSFALLFVAWKLRNVKGTLKPEAPAILFRPFINFF
jgi:uncharacterized membrane protein YqjE